MADPLQTVNADLKKAENWVVTHWKALMGSHAVAVALGWFAHLVAKL